MSTVIALTPIPTPTIEYGKLAPRLIVLAAAVISVLVEAFVRREARRPIQLIVVFGALIVAFVSLVGLAGTRVIAAEGSVAIDGPTLFLQGTVLVLALVGALLIAERGVDPAGDGFAPRAYTLPGSREEREFTSQGWLQTEVWPLFLFSVGGMLLFPAATDLLTMFVALEVLSLPLYLLAGLARRRRLLSQEASLKYFLLGAFSSAFFLFGTAMLYGFAGTFSLGGIADSLSGNAGDNGLIVIGIGLLSVGLLFKVAAVPFHQWTPDVYQGAPTAVTAFMATCVKVAAFGALLRVMYVGLGGVRWDWQPLLWAVAILTMLVGVVLAVAQTDVKRMLAYSSIAHAGFILVGVIAVSEAGISSTLFYLVAYGFATLGAFGVVSIVRDSSGEATHLSQYAGLGKRSPVVASVFALFLLAFAGIPLTSGFTGKFGVFSAAVAGGATPVVIVAVFASVISAFFYARIIVLMFFAEPAEDGPRVVLPSAYTSLALAIGVAVTIVLGVLPQPVLNLAQQAGIFLR